MYDPEVPDPAWPTSSMGDRSALANFWEPAGDRLDDRPATRPDVRSGCISVGCKSIRADRRPHDSGHPARRPRDHPLIQGHLTALAGHETTVRVEWGGRLFTVD
jgi:hypothetical protein